MITKAMKIVLLSEISDQILRNGMMYVALHVTSLFVKFFQIALGNTFGGRSTGVCNQNCGGATNTCKRFDGFCINGCDVGYQGNTCEARIFL
ncbi:hypothetical protein RRG08_043462 [Elysia crispata]|uniref:EGF-like domain-containing protein n=1 Tax=Elysia crispata TaxID=231223 RepID=A0AAE1BDQ4_9GAST|nr:hypothetical protein RRG08_043462 [Elysia crispata]